VLHIPLAIRLPGAARGARERLPVQQIDVAPTLLALVGARAPAEVEGRDLSARSVGTAAIEEPVLHVSRVTYAATDKLAARLGAMKLIVNQEKGRSPESRLELYDLEHDPAETSNLAAARPLVARYLLGQAAQARAAAAMVRERLKAGREVPMTPEQEEQLRALGYIN
jgi:arylsulfatase A-like enzyme